MPRKRFSSEQKVAILREHSLIFDCFGVRGIFKIGLFKVLPMFVPVSIVLDVLCNFG